MHFEDERYIRVYTRDSLTWLSLGWEGQAAFVLLLRKVDRAGVLEIDERTAPEALAAVTGLPVAVCEVAWPRLCSGKDPTVTLRDEVSRALVIPRFIEAQEAKQTDRLRQELSRERRRSVTRRDDRSHNVTECHDRSQHVTPSLAVPSLDLKYVEGAVDAAPALSTRSVNGGGSTLAPDPEKGITRPMLLRLFGAFGIPDELHDDANKLSQLLGRFERKRAMNACEAFLQRAFKPGEKGMSYLVAMCEQNAEPRSEQPRHSNGEREFTEEEKERFRRKHQPPRLPPAKSGAELDAELLARARAEVEAKGGGRR